jgi:hypothetical protein
MNVPGCDFCNYSGEVNGKPCPSCSTNIRVPGEPSKERLDRRPRKPAKKEDDAD